jgi:catechol 2,3-dioxygenase-like lactoylglutathione lyase family enzyme
MSTPDTPDTSSVDSSDRTTRFHRFAPTLRVTDIERSTAFYADALGMTKVFENGDPIGFVILDRDGAELHLTLARDHLATASNVGHLLVDDAQLLHDRLVAHGVRIMKTIRNADHGMRTFVFADPDGNRIDVGNYTDD